MREAHTVSSEVEVAVDPDTAFSVFTEELDLWWQRGPINFYDSARAVRMVCERGVGGRLLEVYDDAGADALELARITVWEPGSRLRWQSSLDDVEVDVRFRAAGAGTVVRVEATVPAGGEDRGGSSWSRVVPAWFPTWCSERGTSPHEPRERGRLALAVHYADPSAAALWLTAAFGFDRVSAEAGGDWTELLAANCSLILFEGRCDRDAARTHIPWVFVDDLDAHHARARANGAEIVEPIRQHGYRAYVADDLEGHRWTFAQARSTMR